MNEDMFHLSPMPTSPPGLVSGRDLWVISLPGIWARLISEITGVSSLPVAGLLGQSVGVNCQLLDLTPSTL